MMSQLKPHETISQDLKTTAPDAWCEPVTIRSYDVDFRQKIHLESLCRYFLEAAWNHAEALGVGFSHLAAENKVWVLSRLLVQIQTPAAWRETIVLRTWPRGRDSLFALRDFEVLDSEQHTIAGGSSAWLVLDSKTRRPQRIEKVVGAIQTVERRATERDPKKLQPPEAADASNPAASPLLLPEMAFRVNYSDEDLNAHVNSARYVRWVLDSYPISWHRNHAVRELEINYLGECRGDDRARVVGHQTAELSFFHSVFKDPAQEACRARLTWT